jgi:hypothetical protein
MQTKFPAPSTGALGASDAAVRGLTFSACLRRLQKLKRYYNLESNVKSSKPPDKTNPISLPPWYPLTIDSKILMKLHDWNEDHNEDSLLHWTKKITRVLESNTFKTALELIPNGTIPAGSVVKAIVAVVALGMVLL